MPKYPKPELLCPAGSFEKMKYAFAYGADAVYAGVPMFSLRARENRFKIEEVAEAVSYARKLKKTIYLTANIFAHNIKLEPFMKAFEQMVQLNPDGFIMSDPGLLMLVRQKYPQAVLHLSTQANNVNWAQAKFWHESLGVKRIILSRELSLKEIAEIHRQVPEVELEAFVHGSICMAYSGRCLLSNYFAARDPNQGVCAHSCRWSYKVKKAENTEDFGEYLRSEYQDIEGEYVLEETNRPGETMEIDEDEYGTYIMNSRDMCAVEYLKELMEAGVMSFKIEGRNKTLHYLTTVTRVYRDAIDRMYAGEPPLPAHLDELASASNRGFIPGFLLGPLGANSEEYKKISYQTHLYVGVVRAFNNDEAWAEVELKNRLVKGEEIDFITPEGVFSQSVQSMWYSDDVNKNDLGEAHGGYKNIRLALSRPITEFSLLRKKISP